MRQRLLYIFTSPRLTYWNVGLCAAAVVANSLFQAFCRPVLWATITLLIAFVPVIFYPRIRPRIGKWHSIVHFLFGIAACICVYCILFLGRGTLLIPLFILLRPYALFGLLPFFLLTQIIYHALTSTGSFKPFASGIALCLVFAFAMATWFHRSFDRVNDALYDPSKSALVPANYMTELMLGMHIKYHTSFCAYDGWRPPLHDPSIVVAAWLNVPFHPDPYRRKHGGADVCPDPIFFGGDRVAVYQNVFPNRSLWQSCACAIQYSKSYLNDAERMHWPPREYVRELRH